MPREEIIERLKILKEFPNIRIEVSEDKSTIIITNRFVDFLNFEFNWNRNHFIGYAYAVGSDKFAYALGSEEENVGETHALISIWNPLEATSFVAAYTILLELRSGRPNPNE